MARVCKSLEAVLEIQVLIKTQDCRPFLNSAVLTLWPRELFCSGDCGYLAISWASNHWILGGPLSQLVATKNVSRLSKSLWEAQHLAVRQPLTFLHLNFLNYQMSISLPKVSFISGILVHIWFTTSDLYSSAAFSPTNLTLCLTRLPRIRNN